MRTLHHTPIGLLLTCLTACLDFGPFCQADETRPYHVVLLKNGELLEGRIERDRDLIVIETDRGVELRIPDRDVSFFGSSKRDVLRFLRNRPQLQRSLGGVNGKASWTRNLQLARWTLEHNLLAECGAELSKATELGAPAGELAPLFERLDQARQRAVGNQQEAASSHVSRNVPEPEFAAQFQGSNSLNQQVLDRALLAGFTKHIQPLLINQCATAGCHQTRGLAPQTAQPRLSLTRPLNGSRFTAAQTRRNLASLMNFVNREHPASSRLWTALQNGEHHQRFVRASDPRGRADGLKTRMRLEQWVANSANLSNSENSLTAQTGPTVPSAATPQIAPPPVEHERSNVVTTSHSASATEPLGDLGELGESTDPYDPEPFNRGESP